jgi:hypothetical protein
MPAHIVIIGHIGSDAGYWYIGADGKIHRVPGWSPEELVEVGIASRLIAQATTLKTPDLANRVAGVLSKFVQEQVGAHLKDGGAGGISVISSPG